MQSGNHLVAWRMVSLQSLSSACRFFLYRRMGSWGLVFFLLHNFFSRREKFFFFLHHVFSFLHNLARFVHRATRFSLSPRWGKKRLFLSECVIFSVKLFNQSVNLSLFWTKGCLGSLWHPACLEIKWTAERNGGNKSAGDRGPKLKNMYNN